jgi:hypothetical protein
MVAFRATPSKFAPRIFDRRRENLGRAGRRADYTGGNARNLRIGPDQQRRLALHRRKLVSPTFMSRRSNSWFNMPSYRYLYRSRIAGQPARMPGKPQGQHAPQPGYGRPDGAPECWLLSSFLRRDYPLPEAEPLQ